jgi:xyloglucan-specific exo-beta-1,4-glucanase
VAATSHHASHRQSGWERYHEKGGNNMSRLRSLPRRALRAAALLLIVAAQVLVARAGPMPTPALAASQSYTFHNVVTGGGGGFVPGIIFNTRQQNLVYARTDIGGAYRWNPTTSSWIPLLDWISPDDWNLTGVESLATDPVDPNRLVLAVGTYTNNFTTQNGAILRSTDQGKTFQRTDLPFKNGGNMPGRSMGERLAIDPNLDSVIYFGARSGNGLWRSTDFGATWSKVTSFTAQATYVEKAGDNYLGDTDGVVWETFDPRTGSAGRATQTIYVGIADKGNSIYRSTDGGATWAAVPGQPSGFLPHHGVLSSTGQLYVTYSNGAGPYDGTSGDVWKLDTASGSWTRISPIPSTDTANDYFGYGGLSVDALHPNTLMVSALNSWWPDTIFFRSTDAGATWTRLWEFTSYPNRSLHYAQDISAAPWLDFGVPSSQAVPPVPSPKAGWMVGSLVIDPFNSDHMLYGTGATIYGSNDLTNWDKGTTFHISVAAAGLEETAVMSLISPPSGAPLISGMGDVGGFRHNDVTRAPAEMFTQPIFSTTNSLDYAETTPNFIVRVGSNSTSGSTNAGFSFDGGTSWFQANGMPSGASGGTVAAAADASRVVWSPNAAPISFSTDNGSSWTASTGIGQGAVVGSDRVNKSKFYGFAGGTFLVSTNGGASFASTGATGLPASGKFKAVPGHDGEIWLAGGAGGLWHSSNSGASFTKLTNVTAADTIGFGKAAPGASVMALFTSAVIGGVHGIFRSDDAGATWVRINDDQHQYGVTNADITGDPRIYGRVYFTTNGRGVIYGDIAGAQTPDFSLSPSASSVDIGGGQSVTVTINVVPSGGFTGSVAFSIGGLPSGVAGTFSPTSSASSTTLTLTASSTPGRSTATITGTSGGVSHTTTISVGPPPVSDFAIAVSTTSLTVQQGGSGTATVSTTPLTGFSGSVTFAATGLPGGVTAGFSPTSVSAGSSTTLTLTASSTAPVTSSPATVTVTGTAGTATASASFSLTVSTATTPSFSLSASPSSLTVAAGSSVTTTITVTPSGGFAGSVSFSASPPSGVTATFSPTSSGTGTTLTLAVASGTPAAADPVPITVTGTSGSLTRTTTLTLQETSGTGGTGGTGGVTITPVVASNGGFFNEEDVKIANPSSLTALSLTITVQRTTGVSFNGQYNTVGSQITQSSSTTSAAITYQFTLAAGQTLSAGTGWTFAAQSSGTGTVHPTTGDTFTATYTIGGQSFTQTGHF